MPFRQSVGQIPDIGAQRQPGHEAPAEADVRLHLRGGEAARDGSARVVGVVGRAHAVREPSWWYWDAETI